MSRWLAPIAADGDRAVAAGGELVEGLLVLLGGEPVAGFQGLVREVSDSLHLRRFCLIVLHGRVPDESTVRKLTRRLGLEVVAELSRAVIEKAVRERRFRARAVRIDSTVVEADVRYPTDSGLAADGVRALAREGKRLAEVIGVAKGVVRDRSRAVARRLRELSRTLARRSGERKQQVLRLTGEAGKLLERSLGEARRLTERARRGARGRGAQAKLRGVRALEELVERCERVAGQIRARLRDERISDRLVSLADPDARPIRKGKQGKPTEFGYVVQIAEVTPNTKPGAGGLVLPAASRPGNPGEHQLLPDTVTELERLGLSPSEVALDGGFQTGPTTEALEALAPERTFIAGRQQPGSKRTGRRLLPHRHRGPHLPPQAPLRAAPHAAQGPSRPADLDRPGDPRLQPRHARRPRRLRTSKRSTPEQPIHPETAAPPPPARPFQRSKLIRGK